MLWAIPYTVQRHNRSPYIHIQGRNMSNAAKYTQEQLDIALLKNTNEGILRTLSRIETEIKSHFHWTMGLILGLYTIGIGALVSALGKAYGVF